MVRSWSSEDEASELAHDVHIHFLTNDFEWGQGDDAHVPSPEEIEEGLAFLKKRLSKEKDGTTIFGGRIAMSKQGKHHDIYVHFGEYDG